MSKTNPFPTVWLAVTLPVSLKSSNVVSEENSRALKLTAQADVHEHVVVGCRGRLRVRGSTALPSSERSNDRDDGRRFFIDLLVSSCNVMRVVGANRANMVTRCELSNLRASRRGQFFIEIHVLTIDGFRYDTQHNSPGPFLVSGAVMSRNLVSVTGVTVLLD